MEEDKEIPKLEGYETCYVNENVVICAKTFDDYDRLVESTWVNAEKNAACTIYRELMRHGTPRVKKFIREKYGVQEDKIWMGD